MRNSKLSSGFKKAGSLLKHGLDPVAEGMRNFETPITEVETLAEQRALTCMGCPKFQTEPIESFRVIDERIPELSNMFCDACGCTTSYKLRQSLIVCPLWEK